MATENNRRLFSAREVRGPRARDLGLGEGERLAGTARPAPRRAAEGFSPPSCERDLGSIGWRGRPRADRDLLPVDKREAKTAFI